MSETLNNWIKEHGNEETGNECTKLQKPEDTVSLDIAKIEVKDFDFNDDTGKSKTVRRYLYFYTGVEKPLLLPKSVHAQIVAIHKEYGDKIKAVKVKTNGEGINTKYEVLPVI